MMKESTLQAFKVYFSRRDYKNFLLAISATVDAREILKRLRILI